VYNDIAQSLSFCLSTKGELLNNTAYFIHAKQEQILSFLLFVLNSKLIDWYYRTLSVQLGEKAVRMFSIYMLKLPIPSMPKDFEMDNTKFIYTLYGLNKTEISFIENSVDDSL